jgi:hypothetical protein
MKKGDMEFPSHQPKLAKNVVMAVTALLMAVSCGGAAPNDKPPKSTDALVLNSARGGWTVEVNPDGTIKRLEMTFGGKRVEVPWRKSDGRSGPAWKVPAGQKADGDRSVPLKKTSGDGLVFQGRSGDQIYSLAYRDEQGDLTLEAAVRNESDKTFVAAPEVRLALGIDHEMNDPKSYFSMFFPSLLRCEKTHFWGYFETPNGQVLAIASKDPVASWARQYIGNGHRIATSGLDFLHATPLPGRHPQDRTSLAPHSLRSWRISLRAVSNLDGVIPAVAAMSGAPAIALTRTTVAPGETVDVALYSTSTTAADVAAVDEQGRGITLNRAKIDGRVPHYQFPAPQIPGLITIRATVDGKQCEAVVYVRKPWGWYLRQARSEALRMQQKPMKHREGWMGFFSAYWAQVYFPDPALLAETEQKFKEFFALMVDPATGDFYKNKPTWNERPQNSSWMLGLLVARYAATQKSEDLEQAAKWADLFITKFQKEDGAYSHGKNSYGALTLGSEFLSQLVWLERPLAAAEARWKGRLDRHTDSIARANANLELVKDLGNTEGEQTYEDSQAGSAWSLLALDALTTGDNARRDKSLADSIEVQGRHECLTQALIPDGRMRGGTLRWWEAQYDILAKGPNMMNSPHGWTMRSQFGALYLYLLTGQERYLDLAFNAMGACAQAIDLKSGTLRWAFIPDPYVKTDLFVPDPENPGNGKYVSTIIGEQWLPMISDWWRVPPGEVADMRKPGWSCDNDVHETFRIMAAQFVPNVFVLEHADGTLRAWNCGVIRKDGLILVTPAENAVSRVHFNLRSSSEVEVQYSAESVREKVEPGMKWVPSKARQQMAPAIHLSQ